jgi:hypothetical protein
MPVWSPGGDVMQPHSPPIVRAVSKVMDSASTDPITCLPRRRDLTARGCWRVVFLAQLRCQY